MHRLMAGVLILAGVIVGGGALPGGTIAAFTDVGTVTGAVAAGTMNLLLSDDDEPFQNDLGTHTWVLTNALPGGPAVCETVQLINQGSVAGSSISVEVVNSGTGGSPMAQEILFQSLSVGLTDYLGFVNEFADGIPGKSVRDLELQGGISGLPGLFANGGNTRSFGACLKFDADAPNNLQGKTWLGTFTLDRKSVV